MSRSSGLESGVACALQAMSSLGLLAKTTGQTVTEIMEPHKDVLQDMIPPKKHLLRHQPLNAQIGLMVWFSAGLIFWVGNAHLLHWPFAAQTGLMVRHSADFNTDLFRWTFAAQTWLMVWCFADLMVRVGNTDLWEGVNRSLMSTIIVVNFN